MPRAYSLISHSIRTANSPDKGRPLRLAVFADRLRVARLNLAATNCSVVDSLATGSTAKHSSLARRASRRRAARATAEIFRGWRPEAYLVIRRSRACLSSNLPPAHSIAEPTRPHHRSLSKFRHWRLLHLQIHRPQRTRRFSKGTTAESARPWCQEFGTVKLGATAWPFSLLSARISDAGRRRRKLVPCPSTVSKSIEP